MSVVIVIAIIAIVWLLNQAMQADAQKNDPVYTKLEQANREIGMADAQYKELEGNFEDLKASHFLLKESFEKLRFNKISADVKLGQKTENILPFLSEFPYASEDIRGLFNPIDLIAFTDTEVIFIEVKTGAAQLSDKQRKIRDNIKAGRVKFEIHRLNEKGVTVK